MFSDKRQMVIEYAVSFESNISLTLSYLLNIDLSRSKALGHDSSSLSFQNKLTLLKDINAIDQKDKVKFDYFSAIRNQFAHNKNATDFKACFDFLVDMDDKLRKLYGAKINKEADVETQREALFEELYSDLNNISDKFYQAIASKAANEGFKEGNILLKEALIETINEFKNNTEENKVLLDEILKITQEKITKKLG